MTEVIKLANGLRLLLVARLSRKKTGTARVEGVSIEIQDATARTWAEREGHAVIGVAADIKSGTTAPWNRRNLKPWMTDPALMAMYDGILIYHTDRLSRGTQEDFTYIEHWAVAHGKRIIVADGPQFPKRDDSDYWRWTSEKDVARKEWERIRARQMGTQTQLKSMGHAVGKPPFGYMVTGAVYAKRFEIDPVTGPVAREAFQRIADGHTASNVAIWLSEQTGQSWRVKRVTEMIKRRTYLGERDGHAFTALVSEELWNDANAAMASRSFKQRDAGGRRTAHGYSGEIFCECGAKLYRHQSERGKEKYRCARGRRGDVTEARCGHGAPLLGPVDAAIDTLMRRAMVPERVMMTTGGDHGRQMELQRLQDAMSAAMAKRDMAEVTRLAAEFADVDARPAEAVRTILRETGRSYADVWGSGELSDRRAMLARGDFRIRVQEHGADGWYVHLDWTGDASDANWKLTVASGMLLQWTRAFDSQPVAA
jgi:DNA invertase Pin-like site-specific DNA recombinase